MASTSTGRFAFLRQLQRDGVTCIFGNPGSSEESILDALAVPEFADLKYYLALHEGSAVAMADAYARLTRRLAVVQLHSYAGLANGLGMLQYARRGYSPMVVFAGEAGLRYEAMDGQMSADLVSIAKPFVKSDHNGPCAWRAVDIGSLLRLLRRAIKSATTPPFGPVFLALPMDVLELESSEDIVPTAKLETGVAPSPRVIADAATYLRSADRPILLIGDGISASRAQPELLQIAELLGATVLGGNYSEVNIPASHPLFAGSLGHMFGEESRKRTSQADVVLICGTTVLPEVFPSTAGVFAKDCVLIHFDLNTFEISKNFQVKIAALADPKVGLAMLADELRRTMSDEQHAVAAARMAKACEVRLQSRAQQLASDQHLRGRSPLAASEVMEEIAGRLPNDAIVFDEALTYAPELCRYIPQEVPGKYFQTRAGMLGTGLPGALGLKIGSPESFVIGFVGDGSAVSTMQAVWTAARYRLGVKWVVLNNRSYRILKYNLLQYWKDNGVEPHAFPDAFELNAPVVEFVKISEGLGVKGARVQDRSDLCRALDAAFADRHTPYLIEVVLSTEL